MTSDFTPWNAKPGAPLFKNARNTETDWLGSIQAQAVSQTSLVKAASDEADEWIGTKSAAVLADEEEISIQATGYADLWAGQFGAQARMAKSAFLARLVRLGALTEVGVDEDEYTDYFEEDRAARVRYEKDTGGTDTDTTKGASRRGGNLQTIPDEEIAPEYMAAQTDDLVPTTEAFNAGEFTVEGAGTMPGFYRQTGPDNSLLEWVPDAQKSNMQSEKERLFPDGIPLRGELTPEQEAWLKSRKSSKTAGRQVTCNSCGTTFFTDNKYKIECPSCGSDDLVNGSQKSQFRNNQYEGSRRTAGATLKYDDAGDHWAGLLGGNDYVPLPWLIVSNDGSVLGAWPTEAAAQAVLDSGEMRWVDYDSSTRTFARKTAVEGGPHCPFCGSDDVDVLDDYDNDMICESCEETFPASEASSYNPLTGNGVITGSRHTAAIKVQWGWVGNGMSGIVFDGMEDLWSAFVRPESDGTWSVDIYDLADPDEDAGPVSTWTGYSTMDGAHDDVEFTAKDPGYVMNKRSSKRAGQMSDEEWNQLLQDSKDAAELRRTGPLPQITDSRTPFAIREINDFGDRNENWIGLFTDQALAEAEAYWAADGGVTQPNLPGYDQSTVKLIRDEKLRRGSSKTAVANPTLEMRPIYEIAADIKKEWGSKVNFAAAPYLDAMMYISNSSDSFYADSGTTIVSYFLSNASTFRGDNASALKAELKRHLGRTSSLKIRMKALGPNQTDGFTGIGDSFIIERGGDFGLGSWADGMRVFVSNETQDQWAIVEANEDGSPKDSQMGNGWWISKADLSDIGTPGSFGPAWNSNFAKGGSRKQAGGYEDAVAKADDLEAQYPDLVAGAEAAYDREDDGWFNALSTEELAILWPIAAARFSYDDEVYDALASRGFNFEASRKTAEDGLVDPNKQSGEGTSTLPYGISPEEAPENLDQGWLDDDLPLSERISDAYKQEIFDGEQRMAGRRKADLTSLSPEDLQVEQASVEDRYIGQRFERVTDGVEGTAIAAKANTYGGNPELTVQWDDGVVSTHGLASIYSLGSRRTASSCADCGASIEEDPEGESNRGWHHNDGSTHDHEATPSKEAHRRTARDWNGQVTPQEFCSELRKYDELWNTGGREHASSCPVHGGPNADEAFSEWRTQMTASRRTAADGATSYCRLCGKQLEQMESAWYALKASPTQREVGQHYCVPARTEGRPGEFGSDGVLVPGSPGGEGGQYDAPAGTIFDAGGNAIKVGSRRTALPGDDNTKPEGAAPQVPTEGLDDSAMFEPDEILGQWDEENDTTNVNTTTARRASLNAPEHDLFG